ncbi:hypothetical protein V8C42DRAFT_338049 [Trichoderma barbatum]
MFCKALRICAQGAQRLWTPTLLERQPQPKRPRDLSSEYGLPTGSPTFSFEVQRKAEQLQKIYSAVHAVLLQDIRRRQERASGKEIVKSTLAVKKPATHEHWFLPTYCLIKVL